MTLIARIEVDGWPAYIGDVLLSAFRETAGMFAVPSVGNANAWVDENTFVSFVDAKQKLCVLSPRCIVAWAGDYLTAYGLVRDIADLCTENRDSLSSEIDRLLASRDDLSNVALIGTVITWKGEQWHFDNFEINCDVHIIGDVTVTVAGSGSKRCVDIFTEFVPQTFTQVRQDIRKDRWPVMFALQVAAYFVGDETATATNLADWWGGAIEVAEVKDGIIGKVTGILHTLWQAQLSESGEVEVHCVPKLLQYDYFRGYLIVNELDGQMLPAVRRNFAYSPMVNSSPRSHLQDYPGVIDAHEWLTCYVFPAPEFDFGKGPLVVLTLENPDKMQFNWSRKGHDYDLRFRESLRRQLAEAVRNGGLLASIPPVEK